MRHSGLQKLDIGGGRMAHVPEASRRVDVVWDENRMGFS